MKGQFNVEYFVALTIFLVFSIYFAFRLVEFYPEYLNNVKNEILRSDSYRLSEVLINDDGWPVDWNTVPSTYRIGLSDESRNSTNYVSMQKVVALNNTCNQPNGYENVKRLLGANHNFRIIFNTTSGSDYVECGPAPASGTVAMIKRVTAVDDDSFAILTVETWW